MSASQSLSSSQYIPGSPRRRNHMRLNRIPTIGLFAAVISFAAISVQIISGGRVAAQDDPRRQIEVQAQAFEDQMRAIEDQVRAVEDQARAAEDQGRAFEDQIRAAEDQVRAAEDQMRALEDQVRAAEDQIRAAQDQVRAAQDQLGTIEASPLPSQHPNRDSQYLKDRKD